MNLLPRPRSLTVHGGDAPDRPPVTRLADDLPPQGYRLAVTPDAVTIEAADQPGLFYGRQTLAQLRLAHGPSLPVVSVEDWPEVAVRGVMLDVSRDKVPTLDTLKALVDRLAGWKVNHLQLYVEHTFAYRNHPEVWAAADPLTPDDVAELDAYCRQRHVELAPNQNCLGHFERWLRHDRYRPLALPESWTDPWGRAHPICTLDPSHPGTRELVHELLGELVPCFPGAAHAHVGLDEPYGLPHARLGDYLDHLAALRALPVLDGREMLVWGDVLGAHPDRLRRLPDGVTVCEWGYHPGYPWAERAAALVDAGQPFWVCPGTLTWLSLGGRLADALANIRAAVDEGVAHGARGVLTCDWGDYGHLQYLPVSEAPLAWAAALAWCPETNADLDLDAATSIHVWDEPTGELARAVRLLGRAADGIGGKTYNISPLLVQLYYPEVRLGVGDTAAMTVEDVAGAEALLAEVPGALDAARSRREDAELVQAELRTTARLLTLACRDVTARLQGDGTLGSVPPSTLRDLASELGAIVQEHRRLWLARNRPGGLEDSAERLTSLADAYLAAAGRGAAGVEPDGGVNSVTSKQESARSS